MIAAHIMMSRRFREIAAEYERRSLERRRGNLADGKPGDDGDDEDHQPDEPDPNGV